jgi:hypothetical protein
MRKNEIGVNAGKIWNVLKENQELSIEGLKKNTKLNNNQLHLALGWLSREDKIFFLEDNDETKICLTEK